MRKTVWPLLSACLLLGALVAASTVGYGQSKSNSRAGTVTVPASSVERPEDYGKRAHTNYLFFVPASATTSGSRGPVGLVPSQVWAAYNLPNFTGLASGAGSGVIAIVDAYDDPTARDDFNAFAKQFGLPQETSTDPTAPGDHSRTPFSDNSAAAAGGVGRSSVE